MTNEEIKKELQKHNLEPVEGKEQQTFDVVRTFAELKGVSCAKAVEVVEFFMICGRGEVLQ